MKPTKPKTPDKVWKLLSKRGAWTQGRSARSKSGAPVPPGSEKAVSFCATGAICRIYGHEIESGVVYVELSEHLKCDRVVDWNDAPNRRKKEVIAAFKAIDR